MSEPARSDAADLADRGIERVDQLPECELIEGLRACCGSTRWVDAMSANRPYGTRAAMMAAASRAAANLKREDWLEAFAHHPRIGDVEALRVRFANATSQSWSRGEQAGVGEADELLLHRLAEGNRRYEERFGYLFIVCATGKAVAQMVDLLEARLEHHPEIELEIAAREQQAITTLRLEKWRSELASHPSTS